MDRRSFVKVSGLAALGLGTPVFGQSPDRVFRTALVGSGWWGMNILRTALQSGRSRVAGLCDVDMNQLSPAGAEIEKLTGEEPNLYKDYRNLLQREKPEIVIVATPDHWHALNTIAAVEAGAHVYVEKPIGHTIMEGRSMVNAARSHDRVVQVGTHRRVSPHNISGMEFLKSGRAGDIHLIRTFVYGDRDPEIDQEPAGEAPEGLDWDMWCGPAPYREFHPRIHPRGFRQFLEYANGTLGDWGIHWLDQVLWWTDQKYPKKISSTGGRYVLQDVTNAPDTQVASYEFDDFTVTWEHRMFGGHQNQDHPVGCYFFGTEGVFHMGWRDGWTFYPRKEGERPIHQEPTLHMPDWQNIPELWADFLKAIETGQRPACDIEIGHRSTNMSLLGMISLKLGRSIEWDGESEQIPGDSEANELLRRDYRNPWTYPGV